METRRSLLKKVTVGALPLLVGSEHALSSHLDEKANLTKGATAKGYYVKVNCAGPAVNGFSADQPYSPGSWGYTHGGQYFRCDKLTNDYGIPAVIQTLRYSCGAPFHYKFDVPYGYYSVKMYFASPNEFYGPRTFDIILNGELVLARFHPFPVNTGFLKQFDNIPVTNRQIDITFRSIVDACLINAIEISQTSMTTPPKARAKATLSPGGLLRTSHDGLLISYYGAWTVHDLGHRSNHPGNALDFTFKGPTIRWIGSKDSDQGSAEIYLDGKFLQTVDTYAPTRSLNQVLWEVTGLSKDRYHTIRILVTRDRNLHSTGCYQDVAAFECQEAFDAAGNDADSAFKEVEIVEAGKKAYLTPGQWRPVANGAESPQTNVILKSGLLFSGFERNIRYQINHWDMSGGDTWVSWLPGANDGRRMMGATNILRWSDNPTLRASLEKLVSSIALRKRADGFALPYAETDLGKTVYGADNERAAYDRRNFTLGLLAAGRLIPSANTIARSFQDWLYSSPYINTMLDGALGIMGGQPSVSMYHSSAGSDRDIIAHERYWRQDWWLAQLKDQQPWSISRFPLNRPHSYVLTALISYCDTYRATGDPRYIDAILGGWQTYRDNFIHIGGSAAICEDCDNAYPYKSYYLNKHTGENCGGALWIDFNHRLLQLYPDQERFAAEIERTLYNVTLANQDTAGNIRYHTNLVGTKDPAKAKGSCCEVTNTDVLARLPEFLYSIANDGLYVNMYSASNIGWDQGGNKVTLNLTTRFPEDRRVSIGVTVDEPISFKIRLRIPSWATGNVSVFVNGRIAGAGVPGTYMTLARTWSNNDTISFNIPIGFRLERCTGFDRNPEYDRYALLYGPLLMSLLGANHLNVAADKLVDCLAPIPDSPLQFSISGHSNSKFVPYYQIQNEEFTCFPTLI